MSAPPVHRQAAHYIDWKKPASVQRLNASHVVEAELEHLDGAAKQRALRLRYVLYWRRRVLAVKCGFELTEQQVTQRERSWQRLGHLSG